MPVDFEEQFLVLRCQTGDEVAFSELIGRYQSRLRYFASQLVGTSDSLEDALQDIWLDVFRGLPRLREPAAFTSWLYRIARRRMSRGWEKRHENGQMDSDAIAEPTDTQFSAEDAEQIHLALDRLSVPHREVLVLRFLEEMSYEAMARVTGTDVGTVRSRLFYAKRHLKQILSRETSNE